jgi:NADH-quinone oxidoreductase subunit N
VITAGLTWLVVIGVISSVIAAFFYLRLAGLMFLEEAPVDQPLPIITPGISTAVSVAAVLVVYLGVNPQAMLQLADNAAALVR